MTGSRDRAFRALMHLYPRRFRERFLEEMVEFYHARRLEQRHRYGWRGGARLWLHLVADVLMTAPIEHVRAVTAPSARTARELPWASPEYPQETHPMEALKQDIRFAFRTLARNPAFTIVAALTLALGIGANTAIFSVVHAVLIRPLPWADSERLVLVYGTRGDGQQGGVVYLDYKDWRAQARSFEEMGVLRGQSVNLTGGEQPDRVIGSFVTASTLRALGATTLQGRLISDDESEVATRQPVAVIGEPMWRTRFGSRPDMLGSTLVLNGQPFTVVGIMRAGFEAPLGTPDVWMPVGYYPNRGDLDTRGRPGVLVVGRLRPGATVDMAQAELDAASRLIATQHPATNEGRGAAVRPLKDEIVGDTRAPLLVVLGAVAAVMLIACANVANLNLARAAARRRELSVRAALGAGRQRLVRQLLTESVVLSALGGVLGLAIAVTGVQWFARVVPDLLPVFGEITLSWPVLGFAATVTVLAAVLFGVAPAWGASRARLQETLTVRGDSGGMRLAGRRIIVAAEIALCVVLLVSAGLLTRSLVALAGVNPGFDADGLLTMQFRLPATKYDTDEKIAQMFERTAEEIRAVPGVRNAALVRATPLNGNGERLPYALRGDATPPDRLPMANANIVTPGYFETMGIRQIAGRDFTAQDRAGSELVAIVNEQLARRFRGSPIGQQIQLGGFGDAPQWLTIVGVVATAKHFSLNEAPLEQVYAPHFQRPLIFTELVVRANGDPMALAESVRKAIWRVDADQPVWRVRPVTLSIDGALTSRRFTMRLLALFALVAVALATIGVYGVMSYMVARRTQEMGVRMALGARPGQVVGMVLRQGGATIGVALAVGLVAAYGASRLLESQLYGVQRADALTYMLAPLVLGAVALLACWMPARRASRVDPVVALRSE
jgi:putative ABC transport system permease protein